MDGLIEGRIVHFVMDRGRYQGEHRPAIVVRVWRVNGQPQANGLCQLQVFIDGTNDLTEGNPHCMWATSVLNDEGEQKPGTWHWIERS